jgi:hypothetical protein
MSEENKNTEPEQQSENIPEETISSEQKPVSETEEQPSNIEVHPFRLAPDELKNTETIN